MATVILIQAWPRNAITGAEVAIRLAGGGSRAYDQLGFTDWRSGVTAPPRFAAAIAFEQVGFTAGAIPTTGAIQFKSADQLLSSQVGGHLWTDARIDVTIGDDETGVYGSAIKGKVAAISSEGGALSITFADLSGDLTGMAVPDTFKGTGGLEGPTEAEGRVKRRSWGAVFNVEAQVVYEAENIYEVGDPSKPLQAITTVRDKGRNGPLLILPWQGSIDATFAGLIGADPPDGGAVVAPSIAMVKWWTQPSGPLTVDLLGETGIGYVDTTPDIAARIAQTFASSITIGNLSEALSWTSAQAGIHAADQTESVGKLLDRLLAPMMMAWIVSPGGVLAFRRASFAAPVETLKAVSPITRSAVFDPLKQRLVGYRKNYRIHGDGEISSAIQASDVFYPDGTAVSLLQPAEAGATVGAPPGTPISTVTSDMVLAALMAVGDVSDADDIIAGAASLFDRQFSHALSIWEAQLLGEERKVRFEELTHFDGIKVATRVRQEISARIEENAAIVTRIDEIEAVATDGIDSALAAISLEQTVRAEADAAETTQRLLQISLVQLDMEDGFGLVQAAILAESTTRANEIEAETTAREFALSAMQIGIDNQVDTLQASIESEATTRATAIAAETTQREQALSTLQTTIGGQISTVSAAIASEATTRATNDAAETLAREQAVSTLTGQLSTATAAIASEASTRATAITAEATLREALAASVTIDLASANAAILNEQSARAAGDSAEATARTALAAALGGDINNVSAAVESEEIARVAADSALASDLSGVSTTLNGATASVSLLLESVDGLSSQLVARVVSGDTVGGFQLAAGGGEIDANFLVDTFRVLALAGGDSWQFSDGRQVTIGGAVMSITGKPFGSSNQFLRWSGPIVATYEDCTEANAIEYLRIDGSAGYAGALTSGLLKNEGSSSTLSTSAFIVVGPFESQGNPIAVNMAARYTHYMRCNAGTGSISGSGGGTLILEWGTDGSTWNYLTSIGANENVREVIVDGDPVIKDQVTWEMTAAGTFTWTPGALLGVYIRLRWSAFSSPTLSGTSITDTNRTQRTSVVAVEY